MTKNEHAIWAARFLQSIFVQRYVSLLSFVAMQWKKVNSYACCTQANHCAIRMVLPTFSQMCLCLLLAGAHVTIQGAHFIFPQYRHSLSNPPFHGIICFRTSILCRYTPFFGTLCCLSCFSLILLIWWIFHLCLLLALIPIPLSCAVWVAAAIRTC